jgi:hypothetical protein
MIGAEEDYVGVRALAVSAIPVEGEHVGPMYRSRQPSVRMHYVSTVRYQPTEVKARAGEVGGVEFHQRGLRQVRPRRRDQGNLMPQLGKSSRQPHHHTLGSPVARDRQATVEVECHVHGAAMYRLGFRLANESRAC